jgi:hypothetical protein
MPRPSIQQLSWRLRISDADLYSRLRNLHPLLNVSGDRVDAYHLCFLEFLSDKQRARKYYVRPVEATLGLTRLAIVFAVAIYRIIDEIWYWIYSGSPTRCYITTTFSLQTSTFTHVICKPTGPTFLPSMFHLGFQTHSFHSKADVQRSLPTHLQIQSYVPNGM